MLQMTNCDAMSPYNITGLQSYTTYTVGVAVCTYAGEGPISNISNRTLAGFPELVGVITATATSTSSITFSWSAVNFNDGSGDYMVSLCIRLFLS